MQGLVNGPISAVAVHLCVDMQRLFSEDGPWPTPWMPRVLPVVAAIAERHAARTIFTRFIPPNRAEELPGTWQRYYRKWPQATREKLDERLIDLMPPLARLAPPARIWDKMQYSAFAAGPLAAFLRRNDVDTLIVTGSETDVCVLATVLGAVDHGFRTLVVRDAICSASDEGHDALLALYARRFSVQIETIAAEALLREWPPFSRAIG